MMTTVVDDAHGFNAIGQQQTYEPERAGPSMAGLSTVPFSLSAGQSPCHPPTTSTGPGDTLSPIPTLSWGRKFLSIFDGDTISYQHG